MPTFQEKLQGIINTYINQIKQSQERQRQMQEAEEKKPFYEHMTYVDDLSELDKNGNLQGIWQTFNNHGSDYIVHTSFNDDGTTSVKEFGTNNGIKFFAKNVYDQNSPNPIASDTLWNQIPIIESNRPAYDLYKKQFLNDPETAAMYASWPISISGAWNYGKTKIQNYFNYLMQNTQGH